MPLQSSLFDPAAIAAQAKGIVTQPNRCWDTIASDPKSIKETLVTYVVPLIVLGSISTFIFSVFRGIPTPLGRLTTPFFATLVYQLVWCITIPVALVASAWVIAKIAPYFGGSASQERAFKLLTYSMTPAFIATILICIPVLEPIAQPAGVAYGLFLCFRGIKPMMAVNQEQRLAFFVVSLVAVTITFFVLIYVAQYFDPVYRNMLLT